MSKFSTNPKCIAQREFVNIPAWHKAGYTGKGLNVFCDDVGGYHAKCVVAIIKVILPDAKIYTGSINYNQKSGIAIDCAIRCVETNEILPFEDFIKKYKISLINNSTEGGDGEKVLQIAEFMREQIKMHNLIFCGAAGNRFKKPTTQPYNGACIVVSSVNLKDDKPVYGKKSIGANIDFAMFHGTKNGTSFSSPFLLGMAGLLRCKYPNISQDEVYKYFKDHCGGVAKSKESGWGIPVMEGPKTIIKLQIGNATMIVDGKEIIFDQPPIIDKSSKRALVPVRAIAEAFGAAVEWDDKTKSITLIK